MHKIAQRRSMLNKLREMTNVSGLAAEKFFNPEFQRVMEKLRNVDNEVRAMVSGQEIENASPGADPVSLKSLLKEAKSNLNRREYMASVADLGRFHKKAFEIMQKLTTLDAEVNAVHHEFLFKDLGDEHKQQLQELKQRFADRKNKLIKEANIMDFFHNIGTQRGRALALWEKRYPKQISKLKKDSFALLSRSESLLGQILSSLKEMASARATRHVDNYMKSADKIIKGYQGYDKQFREYYASNIKGFLEKVQLSQPQEETVKPVVEQGLGQQEIAEVPSLEMPQSQPLPLITPKAPPATDKEEVIIPESSEIELKAPSTKITPTNVPARRLELAEQEDEDEAVPSTIKSPPATVSYPLPPPNEEAKTLKPAHQAFFANLESLSSESPLLVAAYIKKYANAISTSDPITSIQLLQLIQNLRKN